MKPLFLASLFFAASVFAQSPETLDEIEVSGNKEGRTYSETPESVTILPPSRVNRGDQQNSLEVLNGQANVQVSQSSQQFSIRGINSSGATGFQKDNLASIFIDDVFQTDLALRAGSFEVWDMSSLEVYRGPQSTSQGVNSLAGAIILNHNRPLRETEAAVKGGVGSFDRFELGGMANKVFFSRKLAARFSFNKDQNDGFIRNKTTKNKKWGKQDKVHATADLTYFFDDKSELRFNSKVMKTDNGGNYTVGGNPFDFAVREDQDFSSVTNNQQNSLHYTKPWSETVSTRTTLAFSESTQNERSDADATPSSIGGRRREFASDQFVSLENVIRYQGPRVKNALGIHAHQFRSFAQYDFNLMVTTSFPVAALQENDKKRETYALFDSLLYRLDKHQSLNLGIRYEFVKNNYGSKVQAASTGSSTVDSQLSDNNGIYRGDQNTQVLLPKLGYIFEINRHTLGATYSQGYRIGGVEINRAQGRAIDYDPEFTDNYEGSWKYVSGRLQTQANLFYTKWRDQQVTVRKSSDFFNTQVENASDSELYGGELETAYTFESGDVLRAGVGHVETRFLNFNSGDDSYTGNRFPDAAKWTAQTAWSHYFTDKINSNLTVRHVGKSFTNAENTRSAPEQLYLDLNLQYLGQNYVWEINARNLLGKEYVLNSSTYNEQTYQRTNRPREFNTRVTWFF